MKKLFSCCSPRMFFLYVILVVFHRLLSLLVPVFTQKLIDAIPQNSLGDLQFYGIVNLVIILLFIACLSAANYVQECYENGKILLKKKEFAQQVNKIPYEQFSQNGAGYYLQRFHSDIENCRPFIINKPVQVWVQGIYLIAIALLMLHIDVVYALILFSVFPFMMIFYRKLASKVGTVSRKIEHTQDQINSHFEEMLYCNYALRTTASSDWYVSRMDGLLEDNFSLRKKRTSIETIYDFVLITGLLNLLSVAVYYFGGLLVLNQQISIGMVVSMSLYYSKLWSPLEFYLDYPKEKSKFDMYQKRLQEVYKKPVQTTPQNFHPISEMQQIDLQKIHYTVGGKRILNGLSLSIHKGDKIGIVGANGSGKTTLANLICGLLQDYEGSIHYNGINYREIKVEDLVKHICLIPAVPQLFSGTVAENITMGDPAPIPDTLLQILHKQGLEPNKKLLEHGNNLSGGEAKLIQLLRGIYRQCDLYIVDEPLNYIDRNYIAMIIEMMRQLFTDKTLILISHDAKVFSLCDTMISISGGNLFPLK